MTSFSLPTNVRICQCYVKLDHCSSQSVIYIGNGKWTRATNKQYTIDYTDLPTLIATGNINAILNPRTASTLSVESHLCDAGSLRLCSLPALHKGDPPLTFCTGLYSTSVKHCAIQSRYIRNKGSCATCMRVQCECSHTKCMSQFTLHIWWHVIS